MKKQVIFTVATALWLSSCGLYKKYEPQTSTPDNLFGQIDTTGISENIVADSTSFGEQDWHEVFTDTQLQALIEKVLSQNSDLLQAHLNIEQAKIALKMSKLAYVPGFYFTPSGTLSKILDNNYSLTKTFEIPITASWEFDIFGKLTNKKRQAQAAYAQTQEAEQAIKTQLVSTTASLYYTLLMLDRQKAILEETEESWKNSVEVIKSMKDAGMSNEAAVAQMEAAYYSVSASLLDVKSSIHSTENTLAALMHETPQHISRGTLDEQHFQEQYSLGVPMKMLQNRPDVRSAELALEKAYYATNKARGNFYPSITINGSLGWTNSAGSLLLDPAKFVAAAVASLTQPIFSHGQIVGGLKIAKAQQEQAKLSFEQTLLEAGMQVSNALTEYRTARQKKIFIDQQTEALGRAVESTELLMRHGTTTYLDVLTAKQSYLSAQLTQVQNQIAEIQAIITLYQSLGGGR